MSLSQSTPGLGGLARQYVAQLWREYTPLFNSLGSLSSLLGVQEDALTLEQNIWIYTCSTLSKQTTTSARLD
jgi:hypothetical protein